MNDAIDITATQRKTILGLLRTYLPDTEVWIYGSRANWTSHPVSDLDMVVFSSTDQSRRVSDLKDALEESSLPFRVDMFEWDEIPEGFKSNIKAAYVVLQKQGKMSLAVRFEWKTERFGNLLNGGTRNGIYKKREFHGSGAKIVNTGELFRYPRLRSISMKRVEITEREKAKSTLEPGDLIFARRSLVAEGAGKCSIVMDVDETTTFESSIIRARPDSEKVDSLFLYYLFNSPLGLHLLGTIRRQVAVADITGTDLVNLDVPVPTLPEQKAISHILGTLDDKIELNRRMNETLEAITHAIFKSWFVDFDPVHAKAEGRDTGLPKEIEGLFPDSFDESELGEIPKGWEPGSLADLSELNPETWKSVNAPQRITYVDLANTKNGAINSTQDYTFKNAPSRARRVLRPGDTIVGTVRPGNRSFAYILVEGLTGSTGFAVLRPKNYAAREFIYLSATRDDSIDHLAHLADGAAYPAVRPDVVHSLACTVPSDDVLAAFHTAVAPLFTEFGSNTGNSRSLSAARDYLLPALLSGRVLVPLTQEVCA